MNIYFWNISHNFGISQKAPIAIILIYIRKLLVLNKKPSIYRSRSKHMYNTEYNNLSIKKITSVIRRGEQPNKPELIDLWLELDNCCSLFNHQIQFCECCSLERQRQHYEQQFRLLLETVVDEIVASHWRCICLDNVYRPLANIKRLVKNEQSKQELQALFYELSVTSHYVKGSLCI